MRKAVVRGVLAKAAASAKAAGAGEAVQQAAAAAGELVRARREPAAVAARRVRSAKRRTSMWAAVTVVPAAGVGAQLISHGGAAFGGDEILRTTMYVALLVIMVVLLSRAATDWRHRVLEQRALPPLAPPRPAVAASIRPQIARLGEYSDSLRKLAGLTGVDPNTPVAQELRRDIVTSADAAERTLRRRAAELTDLEHAAGTGPAESRAALRLTAERLAGDITAGVAEYGDYVHAVSEIVVSAQSFQAGLQAGLQVGASDLPDRTDQLRGLAMGLRELAG